MVDLRIVVVCFLFVVWWELYALSILWCYDVWLLVFLWSYFLFYFRRVCLSWSFVDWWMALLAPAVMTMSGAICQPRFRMSFIRFAYFVSFSIIFSGGNLSLQYVNSMNWIVTVELGCVGGGVLCGWFNTKSIFGIGCSGVWAWYGWMVWRSQSP
jgi:hypothetical protein